MKIGHKNLDIVRDSDNRRVNFDADQGGRRKVLSKRARKKLRPKTQRQLNKEAASKRRSDRERAKIQVDKDQGAPNPVRVSINDRRVDLVGEKGTSFEDLYNSLSQRNRTRLDTLFSYGRACRYKLTLDQIEKLAESIALYMKGHGLDSGLEFYQMVEGNEHVPHSSDTGKKLNDHYISLLRQFFIMYGIIPAGWEERTPEDTDGYSKYNLRVERNHQIDSNN